MDRVIEFGGSRYEWQWWSGQRLSGSAEAPLALDTETELIASPLHRPRCSLAMAFDGKVLVAIHPSRVGEWLWQHRKEHVVGHNLAFDFWVLHDLLKTQPLRQRLLWDAGTANRLHDTMVLDQLLQLATGRYHRIGGAKSGDDVRLVPRNLAAACEQHGLPLVDKDDPYRLRFGELLDLDEAALDAHAEFADGFAAYALGDVIATYELYRRQRAAAIEVMKSVGWTPKPTARYEIRHDAVERWGPLTEAIQVRASIVLADLSRTPLRVDLAKRQQLEDAARAEYDAVYQTLDADAPGLFKRYVAKRFEGKHRLTKRSLLPQMEQSILKATLLRQSEMLGFSAPQSDGKLKGISTSAKAWARFAERSPFVAAWVRLERVAKQLEFLQTLNSPTIYSRYSLLMRSGRTSASAWRSKSGPTLPGLNIQQLPRGEDVRSLILADEGQRFVKVDYSFIELRTLAALVSSRYGQSKLREAVIDCTLNGGLDPHQRTAARMLGVTETEFLRLPKEQQKKARQDAKAVNFGLPGGLGVETLIAYAKSQYDVSLTRASAKAAKAAWLDVYPEMKLWLGDRTVEGVRYQLGDRAAKVVAAAHWWRRKAATDWLRGAEQPGRESEAGRDLLEAACRVAKRFDLVAAIEEGERKPLKQIVQYRAVTLTGRVRANTNFTDGANSPFQGQAADGAKEALWQLMAGGIRPVIFVHDEVVCSVPAATAERDQKRVEKVMNAAMNDVLDGVPSATEGHVAAEWTKP